MSHTYPIFLNLIARKCLVVGGGSVAERKIFSLVENGAEVYVISPSITYKLKDLVNKNQIVYCCREYCSDDLENVFLCIGATDNVEVNARVASDCNKRNIICNIIDDPTASTFIVPSIVRQGDLAIAISTGGKSPMFTRRLKEKLEKEFGPEYGKYLNLMGELREEIINNIPDSQKRYQLFRNLVDSDILKLMREGDEVKLKERIHECLSLQWD